MTHLLEESEQYTTSDLGTATFLLCRGHTLVDTSLVGARRLLFHFKRKKDTDSLVSEYVNGTGEAPAKHLFSSYRQLRALSFERTGNLR